MRKLFLLALSSCMLACVTPNVAFASSKEVEPNDVRSKAVVVDQNATVTADTRNSDVDYFKTVIKKDGYINIGFDFASSDVETDDVHSGWSISVYMNDEKLPCFEERYVQGKLNLPKLPVRKGTVVYVKVASEGADGGLGIDYNLKFNAVANSLWEKENNETKSKATKLISGKTHQGNIQWGGEIAFTSKSFDDVDYWKYTVENDGYFNFQLKPSSIDTELDEIGNGWEVNLYVGSDNKPIYRTVVSDKTLKSPKFAFKKGTVLYLKVNASGGASPEYVPYSLKLNATKSSVWENEKNNTTKTAKKMTVGKTYNGSLACYTSSYAFGVDGSKVDNDYFKVTATKTGKMKLYFGKKSTDQDAKRGFDVVVKTGSKTLKKLVGQTKKYSGSKSVCTVPVKKGQVIYVKVSGNNTLSGDYPTNVEYSLKMKY